VPVDPTNDVTTPGPAAPGTASSGPTTSGISPSATATPGRAPVVPPKIMAAFKRYRIAAFVVGWGLLLLCAAMVAKYVFDVASAVAIWGPIHGALFVIYVIIAFDLAYKDRWSPLGTIWVLIAGTIPFVSFVAERQVQRKVLARQKM
jgi:integral membrane protein